MGAMLCVVAALALTGAFPRALLARPATLFTHRAAGPAPLVTVGSREVLVGAGILFALLCCEVVAMLVVNGLFRRTVAGEAFFFVSYVASLSLEVLRLVTVALVLLGYGPTLSVVVTRVVYMGRIFGLASLFFATLCSLGTRYSDFAVLSGISVLLALAMGSVVPVDSASVTVGFVHAVSDGGGLLSVGATATAIVTLGAIATPLVRQERRLLGYAAGVICLLAARELLALGSLAPAAAGLLLFVGGTYLYARSLERVYLGVT